MMNIDDVQKVNNDNNSIRINNTNTYSAFKSSDRGFSYYVETNKTGEVQEQLPENQDEKGNPEEENKEQLLSVENLENQPLAYVQNFQMMNNELFDLGISDNQSNNFFDKDMFAYSVNLQDLTMNDIKVFDAISQKTDLAINSFDAQTQTLNITANGENLGVSYRSLEVSNSLFTAIDNASKTGKPVRLDFGQDASVILKINKDGKLSADFIPNEKAMETVLKNALPQLKAKFDEENLPYNELNYRSYNQQKNNQKQHKEKDKDE